MSARAMILFILLAVLIAPSTSLLRTEVDTPGLQPSESLGILTVPSPDVAGPPQELPQYLLQSAGTSLGDQFTTSEIFIVSLCEERSYVCSSIYVLSEIFKKGAVGKHYSETASYDPFSRFFVAD
jgi:hypothetical protein